MAEGKRQMFVAVQTQVDPEWLCTPPARTTYSSTSTSYINRSGLYFPRKREGRCLAASWSFSLFFLFYLRPLHAESISGKTHTLLNSSLIQIFFFCRDRLILSSFSFFWRRRHPQKITGRSPINELKSRDFEATLKKKRETC